MTNTTNTRIWTGARVTVYGKPGKVMYIRPDGWHGVRLDGEDRVDEWQRSQIEAA